MSKEHNINDILSHLNTDMGLILEVLKKPSVFEVMVNPYLCQDGTYELHVWFEEAGVGQKRLITEKTNAINYPSPKIGDSVLLKKQGDKILSWHIISEKIFSIFSFVICNNIIENNIEQIDDYELNVLAENIKNKKLDFENKIDASINADNLLKLLEHKISDLSLNIQLELIEVDDKNLSNFNIVNKIKTLEYVKIHKSKASQIMSILAAANSLHVHDKKPILECSIPYYNHRFTGILPPAAADITMCIRKHSSKVITLDQYVSSGIMNKECADTIKSWVDRKFNILIAGGTGSGKTTMANAILNEIKNRCPQDRVGIIEDTPELQCEVPNHYKFCKTNEIDLPTLLRTSLRMRPDRIVVGEIRGKEAYTLLKAWLSGHPGGLATIHANGANEALYRFEQCISENSESGKMPKDQIAYAINGIISIQKRTVRVERNGVVEFAVKRKLTALRVITGFDPEHDKYEDVMMFKDDDLDIEKEEIEKESYLD